MLASIKITKHSIATCVYELSVVGVFTHSSESDIFLQHPGGIFITELSAVVLFHILADVKSLEWLKPQHFN